MTEQVEKITRYTLVLPASYQAKLAQLAKTYKISQGEVMEVFLDQSENGGSIEEMFTAKRHDKIVKRNSKKTLAGKIKSLTPEQIAMIESMTGGQQ